MKWIFGNMYTFDSIYNKRQQHTHNIDIKYMLVPVFVRESLSFIFCDLFGDLINLSCLILSPVLIYFQYINIDVYVST